MFILSSANALNLYPFQMLLFGKQFKFCCFPYFRYVQEQLDLDPTDPNYFTFSKIFEMFKVKDIFSLLYTNLLYVCCKTQPRGVPGLFLCTE